MGDLSPPLGTRVGLDMRGTYMGRLRSMGPSSLSGVVIIR